MAASDLTTVAFIYKRVYTDRAVGDLATRRHPLFKRITKEGGFTGVTWHYPIRYGNPQGISGTFADAQTGAESSKGVQLAASRKRKYGVITLDGEAMAAAEGNKGAFMDLVTGETDAIIEELGDSLAFDLYRDGTGARGRRSTISTNTVTLTVADEARNFKVGMTVIASANADGSSPRSGSTKVASVDEDAGTVTLVDASQLSSFQNSDYLFRKGDPATCMEGLASLFPLTTPAGSENFRGIDRSVDPRRLAGVRVNDTATNIEENAGAVASKISTIGKSADALYVNPMEMWAVARRLNAKVEYDGGGGEAAFGFQFIGIHTPAGEVKMYADPDCPRNRGYVLNMECLYLKHLRGLPHIVQDDGRPSLRQTSADGIEARARSWVNFICTEPGANGVFAI